jgi:opacity protein-like surface antigen
MTKFLAISVTFFLANICNGQLYNKDKVCGTDTIYIDYRDLKTGEQINYKAFECTQVAKTGIRVDLGYISYSYNPRTKNWLGNHSGVLVGLTLVHRKFSIGAKFKLATTTPKSQLAFNGDTLTYEAKLNPPKIDFYAGYSFDLKYNFSIEPYVGVTRNLFYVINEKDLNKSFDIPKVHGLITGVTLNKYFKLKEFQFLSIFITYGYGFSNFKKVHSSLGVGYSEWTLGLSYKAFAKKSFHERIH